MKPRILSWFKTVTLVPLFLIASCNKGYNDISGDGIKHNTFAEQSISKASDRIDAILKDLAKDQYSLHFDSPMLSVGITKTAYGAENYLVFADPQDLTCPDPLRKIQLKVPVPRPPVIGRPITTCPDFVMDLMALKRMKQLITEAYPQFRDLKEVPLGNQGGLQ